MSIGTYIKSDLYRYAGDTSVKAFAKNFLRNRSFRYCLWFRLCSSKNPFIRLLARIARERLSKKSGIQIPPGTKIGYGLYLGHQMSIVVHPFTVIGDNCNLSQFTTIGSGKNTPAKIGNNVYIGPGCCIVEDVEIGDFAIVGAGSVVVKNVEPYTTVAGNPAKPISKQTFNRFIKRAWPPET
jgi:serine O-acetyltransferase